MLLNDEIKEEIKVILRHENEHTTTYTLRDTAKAVLSESP